MVAKLRCATSYYLVERHALKLKRLEPVSWLRRRAALRGPAPELLPAAESAGPGLSHTGQDSHTLT